MLYPNQLRANGLQVILGNLTFNLTLLVHPIEDFVKNLMSQELGVLFLWMAFSGLSLGIVGTPRFPSPNGEYVRYCELPRI